MLFYTSLFVASALVALVIFYVFSALRDVGRLVFKAFLPSSKNELSEVASDETRFTTVNETLTPWGWSNDAPRGKAAHTNRILSSKQTPWGWKGNNRVIRTRDPKTAINSEANIGPTGFLAKMDNESKSADHSVAQVGWPYREEKFEFAGKSYKVTRKARLTKTNLRETGKPWGW